MTIWKLSNYCDTGIAKFCAQVRLYCPSSKVSFTLVSHTEIETEVSYRPTHDKQGYLKVAQDRTY